MAPLSKLIYRFSIKPVKILSGFFAEIDHLILKFIWKFKWLRRTKQSWKRTKLEQNHTSWFQNLLQSCSNQDHVEPALRYDIWVSGKELKDEEINSWRKWQPTPIFLPGEFHGERSLVGSSPWGHKESDTTEWLTHFLSECIALPTSNHFNLDQPLYHIHTDTHRHTHTHISKASLCM